MLAAGALCVTVMSGAALADNGSATTATISTSTTTTPGEAAAKSSPPIPPGVSMTNTVVVALDRDVPAALRTYCKNPTAPVAKCAPPVPDVKVSVYTSSGKLKASKKTNAKGEATFVLAKGHYRVHVAAVTISGKRFSAGNYGVTMPELSTPGKPAIENVFYCFWQCDSLSP